MGDSCPEPSPAPKAARWQFGLRQMIAATTAVAAVLSLSAWGGWIHSDAVAYLSIALVAAVFSSTARRALLGGCVIVGAFWLAMVLGHAAFGARGRGLDPRFLWIFAVLLTPSATILRLCTKAGAVSLATSLLLSEIFAAIVIVYTYGCPTLLEAFARENRHYVLQHLRGNFFTTDQQWLIVAPWLAGIVLGEVVIATQTGRRLLRREAPTRRG